MEAVETPLTDMLVLDLSEGIGGAYASKILADGGAEVIKVELAAGDPLRRRSVTGADLGDRDGALFRFLTSSKSSVVVDPESAADQALLDVLLNAAQVVVWSENSQVTIALELSPAALRRRAPQAVVAALSPFGLDGPWSGRPSTPATIESWAGGPAWHGTKQRPPVIQGGEPAEWIGGTYLALATLLALYRTGSTGAGDLVDVSMLEALSFTQVMHACTFRAIGGKPWRGERQISVPEIHPTKDGYVGFMVVTGQQWLDFCVLVEQPDWADDPTLFNMARRAERRDELVSAIDAWTLQRTMAEATELASLLRIPATPVASGATSPQLDQFVECNFFTEAADGGFIHPEVPYTLSGGASRQPFRPAPALGEHTEAYRRSAAAGDLRRPGVAPVDTASGEDPFRALRIADFTQFWAGGTIAHPASMLGADVIHVESTAHPDGARYSNVRAPGEPDWWEYGPFFQSMATNKRGLTLELSSERGRELARELVRHCDVVVENYTPRVMDNWGMSYEQLRQMRPDLIMLRAPAFGLHGPWRERGGYAPILEQASGIGFITGYPDDNPLAPMAPGDPIAGAHATIALLLALFYRRRTGKGMLVESPMAGAAVNIAAEGVVEYSAYGNLLTRMGNRSAFAAPQGMYLTADTLPSGELDRWVMISVASDQQWTALCNAIGHGELLAELELANVVGRRDAHDRLDAILSDWCSTRTRAQIVETLWGAGVPVAEATLGHELDEVEQHQARQYFRDVSHPIHGELEQISFPMRLARGPEKLIHRHAPLLGEHNTEVLQGILGLSDVELDQLTAERVIGRSAVQPDQTWSV